MRGLPAKGERQESGPRVRTLLELSIQLLEEILELCSRPGVEVPGGRRCWGQGGSRGSRGEEGKEARERPSDAWEGLQKDV